MMLDDAGLVKSAQLHTLQSSAPTGEVPDLHRVVENLLTAMGPRRNSISDVIFSHWDAQEHPRIQFQSSNCKIWGNYLSNFAKDAAYQDSLKLYPSV